MEHNNYSHNSRTGMGILLIIVGILFFMKTFGLIFFNVFHFVFSFPFILFAIGLMILINSRRKWFGIFLTLAGALLLLPKIFPAVVIDSNMILAIFVIGLGLSILFKKHDHSHFHKRMHPEFRNEKSEADFIDDVAIFSGSHRTVLSDNFKGGNITALFGGSKIDLSSCKLAEGNNVIDVVTIFGGTTIIVPNDWNININVMPIFGGFSSKIRKDPSVPLDLTRTLTIKGISIFGGGEIKSNYL